MTAPRADWVNAAACAETDPELFFPLNGETAAVARRICRGCPVRRDCLATALTRHEWGVWGGTTEHERERLGMRRSQRITGGAP
jgi:WhiB family redox-sensing transcriptional regulator